MKLMTFKQRAHAQSSARKKMRRRQHMAELCKVFSREELANHRVTSAFKRGMARRRNLNRARGRFNAGMLGALLGLGA